MLTIETLRIQEPWRHDQRMARIIAEATKNPAAAEAFGLCVECDAPTTGHARCSSCYDRRI